MFVDIERRFGSTFWPLAGGMTAIIAFLAWPGLYDPLQALIELCLGAPEEGGEQMEGGILMWFTMRPWLVIAVVLSLSLALVFYARPWKRVSAFAGRTARTPETVDANPQPDRMVSTKGQIDSSRPDSMPPDQAHAEATVRQGATSNPVNIHRLYDAVVWAARATGGVAPSELAQIFEDLTGLNAPHWARHIAILPPWKFNADDLNAFDEVESEAEQRVIVALVLGVGWRHGDVTPRLLDLASHLSTRFNLSTDQVMEISDAVSEQVLRADAA